MTHIASTSPEVTGSVVQAGEAVLFVK